MRNLKTIVLLVLLTALPAFAANIKNGEELVEKPFERLIDKQLLGAYRYDGFFVSMDTFKERQSLDSMYTHGTAPWELWSPKRQQG